MFKPEQTSIRGNITEMINSYFIFLKVNIKTSCISYKKIMNGGCGIFCLEVASANRDQLF